MDIPISNAGPELSDLVRRAEAGEDVVLTRNGEPVVRLSPVPPKSTWRQMTPEERRAALADIVERAGKNLTPGLTREQIDDEMYDEFGLPK